MFKSAAAELGERKRIEMFADLWPMSVSVDKPGCCPPGPGGTKPLRAVSRASEKDLLIGSISKLNLNPTASVSN